MKPNILFGLLAVGLLLSSCGENEFIEKGKKAKCKLEELNKQLVADPDNFTIQSEINENITWLDFYRKEYGDASAFDAKMKEHTCN